MKPVVRSPWIPLSRMEQLVQVEPVLALLLVGVAAWLFWKVALRDASPLRQSMLRADFVQLGWNGLGFACTVLAFLGLDTWAELRLLLRVTPYIGLLSLLWGAVVFVLTAKVVTSIGLFAVYRREGVPAVLINTVTVLVALMVGGWLATQAFAVQLAPLLATSAAASLVVGLALQEPLGNLFAGIALQFDKPYELGDWVEVSAPGGKWVGKVEEVSWRATVLIGWYDEQVHIPNRVISQSQIVNWSARGGPVWKSASFRLPVSCDRVAVDAALRRACVAAPLVKTDPPPSVFFAEVQETWLHVRLFFAFEDFGRQLAVTSQVTDAALAELAGLGIPLAAPVISLLHTPGELGGADAMGRAGLSLSAPPSAGTRPDSVG